MSQVRQKAERVGEIAAKAVVQLLFSAGKSSTVDGLRENPAGTLHFETTGQVRQNFSFWTDQDAFLANFVGDPLPRLELESLSYGCRNSSLAPASDP
jgi:hypothetical protein